MRARSCLIFIIALLAGCSSVTPRDYAGVEPEFVLEEYFAGRTEAWGLFQDRSGKVVRRFQVTLHGYREGDEFVLDEYFRYADGETDRRTWRLRRVDEHRYEGRAGDVVGVATGTRYGNAFHWEYVLALEVDGTTWNVHLDDWMYLLDGGVLVNRAEMSKFGIHLGDITLFFRKPDATATQTGHGHSATAGEAR
jgi:hypothetical protein